MTTTLKRRLRLAKSKKLKRPSRMAKAVGMNKSFRRDSEKTIKINVQVPPKSALKDFRTVQYTPELDGNVSFRNHDTSTTYYYNQDERQSVKNLTNSTGAVVRSYDYTAYGDPIDQLTNGTITQRYTYTGRELNDVSGNYYFRYRMYGAGLGGFLSRDPAGYVDGLSLFNGYFVGMLAMDPYGDVVTEIEIGDNTEKRVGLHKSDYIDQDYAKNRIEVQKAIKDLQDRAEIYKQFWERMLEEKKVTFNGKAFTGTFDELSKKVNRETNTERYVIGTPSKKTMDGFFKEAVGDNMSEDYDEFGVTLHAYLGGKNKAWWGSRKVNRADALLYLGKGLKKYKGKGTTKLVSCGINPVTRRVQEVAFVLKPFQYTGETSTVEILTGSDGSVNYKLKDDCLPSISVTTASLGTDIK
ncbi:hypothetical protein BVX99_01990 [bacterium F16]|nr:hypothetical protein BVX99_01990 [bacterium F16]